MKKNREELKRKKESSNTGLNMKGNKKKMEDKKFEI